MEWNVKLDNTCNYIMSCDIQAPISEVLIVRDTIPQVIQQILLGSSL